MNHFKVHLGTLRISEPLVGGCNSRCTCTSLASLAVMRPPSRNPRTRHTWPRGGGTKRRGGGRWSCDRGVQRLALLTLGLGLRLLFAQCWEQETREQLAMTCNMKVTDVRHKLPWTLHKFRRGVPRSTYCRLANAACFSTFELAKHALQKCVGKFLCHFSPIS